MLHKKIIIIFALGVMGQDTRYQPLENTIRKLRTCGLDNLGGRRITGPAVPAGKNTWPWLVRLLLNQGHGGSCAGTLISSNVVITAAHCCAGVTNMTMIFGDLRRDKTTMQEFNITVTRKNIKINPAYFDKTDGTGLNNDICMIDTGVDVLSSQPDECRKRGCVKIACFPNFIPKPGDACWIAGWGKSSQNGGGRSRLFQGGVNIMDTEMCKRESSGAIFKSLQADELCAGDPDIFSKDPTAIRRRFIDACQGDSGGPLICDVRGKATLTGIVSWGRRCGRYRSPGVYANVAESAPWILTTAKSFDRETPDTCDNVKHQCPKKNVHIVKVTFGENRRLNRKLNVKYTFVGEYQYLEQVNCRAAYVKKDHNGGSLNIIKWHVAKGYEGYVISARKNGRDMNPIFVPGMNTDYCPNNNLQWKYKPGLIKARTFQRLTINSKTAIIEFKL